MAKIKLWKDDVSHLDPLIMSVLLDQYYLLSSRGCL